MSTKKYDGHVRFSESDKMVMDKMNIGLSRVFRVGFDTLRMWIQPNTPHSCFYLYNTGKNRAPPDAAVLTIPQAPAQGCPCPVCPIRAAFGTVPHEKIGQKENHSAAAEKENDPISCS